MLSGWSVEHTNRKLYENRLQQNNIIFGIDFSWFTVVLFVSFVRHLLISSYVQKMEERNIYLVNIANLLGTKQYYL